MIPQSIQNLINQFVKLPGIGPRAAIRLAFFMLRRQQSDNISLAKSIANLKFSLKRCKNCFNIANNDLCVICSNKQRDRTKICIVEDYMDLISLEKTGQYNGLYHVLGGIVTMEDKIQAHNLHINELLQRIKKNQKKLKEIIIATNPTTEGDTTALYLLKILKSFNMHKAGIASRACNTKISRLARGLPTGGDIEYLDERTLSAALKGRNKIL